MLSAAYCLNRARWVATGVWPGNWPALPNTGWKEIISFNTMKLATDEVSKVSGKRRLLFESIFIVNFD